MASAILLRWPHLKEGLSNHDATSLWKHRIRSSFKNLRRRSSLKTCPVVISMKEKCGKSTSEPELPLQTSQKNVWGVANFLPERMLGEDEKSIQSFVEKIKAQKNLTPGRRNNDLITMAMDRTFPERSLLIWTMFLVWHVL